MTSQMPESARRPLMGRHAENGAGPMPEMPQMPDSVGRLLQFFLDKIKPQHEPILKSLQKLGVTASIQDVNGAQSLVVPVKELIQKEYGFMAGVDMGDFNV